MPLRRAPLLALLVLVGCGGGETDQDATLTIYSSVPVPAGEIPDEIGDFAIELETLPTASEPAPKPAEVGAAARAATSDSTAVAYIGERDRSASRTSASITNGARLLQVAPVGELGELGSIEPSGDPSLGAAPSARQALADVIAAIEAAEDPGDRESVIGAYLAGG